MFLPEKYFKEGVETVENGLNENQENFRKLSWEL